MTFALGIQRQTDDLMPQMFLLLAQDIDPGRQIIHPPLIISLNFHPSLFPLRNDFILGLYGSHKVLDAPFECFEMRL